MLGLDTDSSHSFRGCTLDLDNIIGIYFFDASAFFYYSIAQVYDRHTVYLHGCNFGVCNISARQTKDIDVCL